MEKPVEKIVRLLSTDIKGDLPIFNAMLKIKGISFMFSSAICKAMKLNPKTKIGSLNSEDVKKIEEFIKNPNVPEWMMNRKKDPSSGKNKHLVTYDIDFAKREDINKLRKIRSYRGIRHESRLPVRGQRTRSSFRKNKTIGVTKKKKGVK